MNKEKKTLSKINNAERILIALFCAIVTASSIMVLLFVYKPNQNALGALGTVCMDVISMIILLIMVISIAFEKDELNRTTKLFMVLLIATLVAMFFDFLTWSADGALAYGNATYLFTVSSLIMGSVLAGIFCLYLSSYFEDMYQLKSSIRVAELCVCCDAFAFVLTLTLALTNNAFDFVDGHYQTGALYDLVTAIPVLTLVVMTAYAVFSVRKIGIHDLAAVVGYIFTMIVGALIESAYSIGTTYVGVTIANIFIFIMLQNKLIDRVNRQREALIARVSSQYEILESMAGIYSYVNYVDLAVQSVRRIDLQDSVSDHLDLSQDAHSKLTRELSEGIDDELKDKFWEFTDLITLPERMGKEKIITAEFLHDKEGWFRASYIRIGDVSDEPITRVIFAVRNINEEKKKVEKWIKRSNTDELTGFFNRRAFEDDMKTLKAQGIQDNLVYISIDVNSLKVVNDTLGHEAGDELLLGASECVKQCLNAYGKLFRIGGDEFVAIINAEASELDNIRRDLEEVTGKWQGKINKSLALSCGYVMAGEVPDGSLHKMAVLADQRMYEDKSRYYRGKGVDRRGQQDAHVALCGLYTKILKVNLTEDTYQIVNMDSAEQAKEKGFSEQFSQWMHDFGTSGQVHNEDLEEYLAKTDKEYMINHFKNNDKPIRVFYRRKYVDSYKRVMLEIIKTNDYSEDSQKLFLYVKDIDI